MRRWRVKWELKLINYRRYRFFWREASAIRCVERMSNGATQSEFTIERRPKGGWKYETPSSR